MSRSHDNHGSSKSKFYKMLSRMVPNKRANLDVSSPLKGDGDDLVIGLPTGMQHNIKVTINEHGEIENLPSAWITLLDQSDITLV